MRKQTINPTPQQFLTLAAIRTRLAELDCTIADVSAAYRRHATDFVAIPTNDHDYFMIVRIAPKKVVVQPFGIKPNKIIRGLRVLRGSKRNDKFVYHGVRMAGPHDAEEKWRPYVDPADHEHVR